MTELVHDAWLPATSCGAWYACAAVAPSDATSVRVTCLHRQLVAPHHLLHAALGKVVAQRLRQELVRGPGGDDATVTHEVCQLLRLVHLHWLLQAWMCRLHLHRSWHIA